MLNHIRLTTLLLGFATATLMGQGPNPAANPNLGWQMQQQNFQAQRMMQLQNQMFRQMQVQQSQMHLQRNLQQQLLRQPSMTQVHQANQLEDATRKMPLTAIPVLPKPTREAWKVTLGTSNKLPCYDGARLMGVTTEPTKLLGLDMVTGKVNWECLIVGKSELDPLLVGDQVLYVNGDYLAVLIDATSGKERHRIQLEKLGGFVFSAKKNLPKVLFPTLHDHTLILPIFGKGKGGAQGIVYAIDTLTGQKCWEALIPDGNDLTPVVNQDKVIVGGAGRIMALNLETGIPAWVFDTGSRSPLMDGPLLGSQFHVICEGQMFALDGKTGKEVWRTSHTGDALLFGEGDRILFTEMRGAFIKKEWIVALDTKTGTKVWDRKVGSTHMPWIHDGQVICTADNLLLALNLQSGKQIWERALDKAPRLPISISGEAAYLVTGTRDQQQILAVKLKDGDLVWAHPITENIGSGLLLPMSEGLLLPGDDGSIFALK